MYDVSYVHSEITIDCYRLSINTKGGDWYRIRVLLRSQMSTFAVHCILWILKSRYSIICVKLHEAMQAKTFISFYHVFRAILRYGVAVAT